MGYIGRFAPSPSGPLHIGSLIAAVASYCEAKVHGGQWLVRMEDADQTRIHAGAAADILHTLECFGFEWDIEVMYQSQRTPFYEQARHTLQNRQLTYPCTCSRKEIADSSTHTGIEGKIYPKTCWLKAPNTNTNMAWRVATKDKIILFNDAIQGEISQNLATDIGDFVLKRADGYYTYQLAVVVDDAAQGVTHIVRGADLLNSTPRQIYLQQLLALPTPHYAHVPVAVNAVGEKLSKQTLAEPIIKSLAGQQLFTALQFLGQNPPIEIQNANLNELWRWAFSHWSLSKISKVRAITSITID